jgi:ATP-dependent DNA helicase RecQ
VDRGLFEEMRGLRKELADQRQVPPYVIFSDATLREMARMRPSSLERMRLVYGVGETKLREYGERFLQVILSHGREYGVALDQKGSAPKTASSPPVRSSPTRDLAWSLFRQGAAVENVVHQTNRGRATVFEYLCDYVRQERPASLSAWVADVVYQRVVAAARQHGTERLKPIFLALGEQVPYDEIRLVLTHLQAKAERSG